MSAAIDALNELLGAGTKAAEAPRYELDDYIGRPPDQWPTVTVPVPVYAVLWEAASERDLGDLIGVIPPATAGLEPYAPGNLKAGRPLCPDGRSYWTLGLWAASGLLLGALLWR
jgi:hypothetical protein